MLTPKETRARIAQHEQSAALTAQREEAAVRLDERWREMLAAHEERRKAIKRPVLHVCEIPLREAHADEPRESATTCNVLAYDVVLGVALGIVLAVLTFGGVALGWWW